MRATSVALWLILGLIIASAEAAAEGRKLAVVVGVNAYRANSGLPNLKHAAADAAQLSEALRQQGYTVNEMTHEVAKQDGKETFAPNIAYIRDEIAGVLGHPNLGRDDAIIITLHGHGVQFDLVDDGGKKNPQFYFCPADSTIAGLKSANDVTERHHLLPLDELYDELAQCTAATKLLIVDACRNDPTEPTIFKSGLASATLPKLPPPPGGTAAFFSCKADQRAIEDPELERGVFTHFLVQGLSGKADQPLERSPADGIVTFAELSTYVANNTYAHVYNKYRVRQSPELRGDYDLNLPLAHVKVSRNDPGDSREFTRHKIKFCWCPPGEFEFRAKSLGGFRHQESSYPPIKISPATHEVTLSTGFWLSTYEVSTSEFVSVLPQDKERKLSGFPEGDFPEGADPALRSVGVNWKEANRFCQELTLQERALGQLGDDEAYSLPTLAQWQYAMRADSTTPYFFGTRLEEADKFCAPWAWPKDIRGTRKANSWGLHDMIGAQSEWCLDWLPRSNWPQGLDPVVPLSDAYVSEGDNPQSRYHVLAGMYLPNTSNQGNIQRDTEECEGVKFEGGTEDCSYYGFRIARIRTR
ncbi:MAG: SUMF1/EgtB/PvdO family nonheme iron enzyme [Planctomycetaceae bacterium]|nr:SUMF1/EgtB/PvdO family nonheme iron enzyme [Planctomycetaceae bacterium]MCA9035739.1 SUMF1/EgtB/PvdO family nonheme iron enzyme [Planctomycetaceae bacterium]